MVFVDQYDLSTVLNRDQFVQTVEFRECAVEGRSLVTKRALSPGDIVLVETPRLRYLLEPNCRSSLSRHYSKSLWQQLNTIVRRLEGLDSTSNDDKESVFCPGVPAAMLAYLDIIQAPTNTRYRHQQQLVDQEHLESFFYYPTLSEDDDEHPTVKLVSEAAREATETLAEFRDLDADKLSTFILVIYANAHTVSFAHERGGELQTHTRKKERRRRYAHKSGGENHTGYSYFAFLDENKRQQQQQRSMICLMSWGSKFAHSCAPNLFLQYEPSQNVMVFRAVRSLQPGDVLSFSYLPEDDVSLGGLVCGTTVMRQFKLWQFKFFRCACSRCTDKDWSRGATCTKCESQEFFRKSDDVWVCQDCDFSAKGDESVGFIGERESHVQQMTVAFMQRIRSSVDEDTLGMIESYLLGLLQPSEEAAAAAAVPQNHWTFGSIHAVLATYHLQLFPQFFGKGLAERFGMTVKGLQEAALYIRFLNNHIWAYPSRWSMRPGNPMAAFFASWRIMTAVIDTVMKATEKTIYSSAKQVNCSDDGLLSTSDEDDEEEEPQPLGVELVPMPEGWKEHIDALISIVHDSWLPLIEKVFAQRESAAVNRMKERLSVFVERVQKVSNIENRDL